MIVQVPTFLFHHVFFTNSVLLSGTACLLQLVLYRQNSGIHYRMLLPFLLPFHSLYHRDVYKRQVEGIAGLRRYTITIRGISGHAGAIPMNQRTDPVPAMCTWITAITKLAQQYPYSVATIGSITTYP